MNLKPVLFIIAILISIVLMSFGGYITIDNLVHPQGNLFEGIMLGSVGLLMSLIITIALSIGKVIKMFGEILNQQELMMQTLRNRPEGGLSSLFGGLIPGADISVTRLDEDGIHNLGSSPINSPEDLEKLRNSIMENLFKSKGRTPDRKKDIPISDMTLEQLQAELSKSITGDNFERAEEITKEIQSRENKN